MGTFLRVRRNTLSDDFQELIRNNLLLCSERQQHFAEKLESITSSACTVNFMTGTLSFGNEEFVIKNIQILGSFSNVTNTWLWSWSQQNDFPEEVLEDACNAKEFGERHQIPEYINENEIPMDKKTALALAMTAVDIVGAEAFYPAEMNNGAAIAFISLRDERLFLPQPRDWCIFMKKFPDLLSQALDTYPEFIPNELKLIEDYCIARGFVFFFIQ